MNRHFIARQVVVDKETNLFIHHQFFHQGCAYAHRHGPDDLTAGGFGVENTPGMTDGQHPQDPNFPGIAVHAHFYKMSPEGVLRILA